MNHTAEDKLNETLETYGLKAKISMSDKYFDKAKSQAKAELSKLILECLPEERTDPDNLAGDPGKWDTTIAGYNQCLKQIKQNLASKGFKIGE